MTSATPYRLTHRLHRSFRSDFYSKLRNIDQGNDEKHGKKASHRKRGRSLHILLMLRRLIEVLLSLQTRPKLLFIIFIIVGSVLFVKKCNKDATYFFPKPVGGFQPLPDDSAGLPNVLYGCGNSARQVDQIQLHVIGWRRHDSIQTLLEQLKYASYDGWSKNVPLYIHLDGDSDEETQSIVRRFEWSHGPKTVHLRKENAGLRSMWLDSLGPAARDAGNNTLMVVFEDDMRVSLSYFQWLLSAIDAYGRNTKCRDSNLVGFSLSPIRMEEMTKPFTRWNAREAMGNRYDNDNRQIAYLSSLPSSWGAAYWSDRWIEFDNFVRLRLQPPFYNATAEENIQGIKYDDLQLTPKFLYIPNARSNVWPKSWKRFMVDFMYACGLVMLYPNLPGEQGLATTLALDGEHVSGSNPHYKNPRVAGLLEHLDLPRLGVLPRYGDLAIFNLHLLPTTRERLAAEGDRFLFNVLEKCDYCANLVELWKRSGSAPFKKDKDNVPYLCAPDLYTSVSSAQRRPTQSSSEKFLLYEPQYGANNQFFAMVEAYFWAHALGRRLVLPPVFLPRVSAHTVDSGAMNSMEHWLDAERFFKLSHTARPSAFPSPLSKVDSLFRAPALEPIGFNEFLKKNVTAWRLIRITRDAMFDEPSRLITQLLEKQAKEPESGIETINLRHLFEINGLTVDDIEHHLGGCDDDVLLFEGMFFANVHGINTRHIMPDVMSLSDEVEAMFLQVKDELTKELGTSNYGCLHFRHGDFISMCNSIETADSDSELYKLSPSFIKTAEEFSCSVSFEELKLALLSFGSPALVMSDSPEIVQRELEKVPLKTVTSAWVKETIEHKILAGDSHRRSHDLDLLSLLVEEQICAESDFSVLNRFSTVSQRIISLRRCNSFWYWRKEMASHLRSRGISPTQQSTESLSCLFRRNGSAFS